MGCSLVAGLSVTMSRGVFVCSIPRLTIRHARDLWRISGSSTLDLEHD
jgi:hypothetical protein